MKFVNQSAAVVFLVAVLSIGLWPSSDMLAQDSSDPFGPSPKQEPDPFGGDPKAEAKPPTKPVQAARPAQRRRRAMPVVEKPTFSSRTLQSMLIRRKLSKGVDLVYDQEPFGDVIDKLVQDLKINIVIDRNLEGVVDDDTEVSANLAGVALADGLRTMLRPVDATYTIRDGTLLIISTDDETEPDYLTRHMIDVRELLKLIKVAESDRIGKPVPAGTKPVLGSVKAVGGVFRVTPQAESAVAKTAKNSPNASQQPSAPQPQELLTAERILTDGISRVVATDCWSQNGGSYCDMTCIGGLLIVVSSELVAEEVQDLVTDLEYRLKNPEQK